MMSLSLLVTSAVCPSCKAKDGKFAVLAMRGNIVTLGCNECDTVFDVTDDEPASVELGED